MVFELAAGIVLGGLVLAFLLKTEAGWYVMVGAVPALVVGAALNTVAIAIQDAHREQPLSAALGLCLLIVIALGSLWSGGVVPHTIRAYQRTRAEREKGEVTEWAAFKWAFNLAVEEVFAVVVVLAFTASLPVFPILAFFGPVETQPISRMIAQWEWGIICGFFVLWAVAKLIQRHETFFSRYWRLFAIGFLLAVAVFLAFNPGILLLVAMYAAFAVVAQPAVWLFRRVKKARETAQPK